MKKIIIPLITLTTLSAWAQVRLPGRTTQPRPIPTRPVIVNPLKIDPATLGTSREAFDLYTNDISKAVKSAMPSYDTAALAKHFAAIKNKYPQGKASLKLRSIEAIQKHFKLSGRIERREADYIEGQDFAIGLDLKKGKLLSFQNKDDIAPIDPIQAQRLKPLLTREHKEIIAQVGIPQSDILFFETDFMMLQGQSNPEEGPVKTSPLKVDNIYSYGLRKLEGIMVDGSSFKIANKSEALETVNITWPDFRFHPAIREFKLKDKKELEAEIVKQLREQMNSKARTNVRIAVVFNPVLMRGQYFFIPSLKVGAYSDNNEGGNMFYISMLNSPIPFESEDKTDNSPNS